MNDQIVTAKRILKSGDVIGVLGKKFRWENKLDAKRKKQYLVSKQSKMYFDINQLLSVNIGKSAESLPGLKKSRKSILTNCITTQRRITILR